MKRRRCKEMRKPSENSAESGMNLLGVAPWGVKWPFSIFIPRRCYQNRSNKPTYLIAWYLLEEASDKLMAILVFCLITDGKKHDFACYFFLYVMLADSSTPTSMHSFKNAAILQRELAVADRGFLRLGTSKHQLQEGTTLFFGQFSRKLHEMKIGRDEGCAPCFPWSGSGWLRAW